MFLSDVGDVASVLGRRGEIYVDVDGVGLSYIEGMSLDGGVLVGESDIGVGVG